MDRMAPKSRVTMKEPTCGHCYEKFRGMVEPRRLPCSHVFCLPCIKQDVKKVQAFQCPTCKRDHSSLNVDNLPKVVRVVVAPPVTRLESLDEVEEDEDLTGPVSLDCNVCNKETADAVSFCIDCGKKMCEKHAQFHDEYQNAFSKRAHTCISMEQYKLSPHKYIARRCRSHLGQALDMACQSCSRTFCGKCDTKTKCPKDGGAHMIKAVEEVSIKFRDRIDMLASSLSDKLNEAVELQQNTDIKLTDTKKMADHMTDEVDRVTNEQISVIRRKAEMLKTEVETYQIECAKQVDRFANSLAGKKEKVDDLLKNTQEHLKNSHDADIIKGYKYKVEEIEEALKIDFGFCQFPFKIMLIRTGDFKDIELQLRDSAPATMKYRLKERNPSKVCSTVCWTEDRDMLCGRSDSLEVRHCGTIEILHELKTSSANGVTLHKQGYLALFWKDGKNYIILYSPEMKFLKLFGEFFRDTDKFSHLTSSRKLVAAVDPDHRLLKVFSTEGQYLYDMKLMGMMRPWGAYFLPDGCILVTDFVAGCLKKYVMKPGNSEPIWVCRDLESPTGISINCHGLIYVSSFNACKIYVISQQGTLLKEITNQKLMKIKEVYDITVSDDQIAMACGNDGVVCFQMMFDALVM